MPFMSLRKRLVGVVPALTLTLTLMARADAQQKGTGESIICPAVVTTTESVEAAPGWNVTRSTSRHVFERISLYNTEVGGREFDLAPDDEVKRGNDVTQTWHLNGYRTMSISLRCRYRDTAIFLTRDLPSRIQTCRLHFRMENQGKLIGASEMNCR
jgi:hypothetical protein